MMHTLPETIAEDDSDFLFADCTANYSGTSNTSTTNLNLCNILIDDPVLFYQKQNNFIHILTLSSRLVKTILHTEFNPGAVNEEYVPNVAFTFLCTLGIPLANHSTKPLSVLQASWLPCLHQGLHL
jgi:hypothetical protein